MLVFILPSETELFFGVLRSKISGVLAHPVFAIRDCLSGASMKKMNLQNLGWTSFFEDQLSSENLHGLEPGRIQFYSGNLCRILTADGERDGVLIGKMRNESTPVTGDWVLPRLKPLARNPF